MGILIVDNNGLLGTYFEDVLHNYQVFCSENGKEALELLLEPISPVKLILCDYEMPIMDGFNFINTIKTSENTMLWKFLLVLSSLTFGLPL